MCIICSWSYLILVCVPRLMEVVRLKKVMLGLNTDVCCSSHLSFFLCGCVSRAVRLPCTSRQPSLSKYLSVCYKTHTPVFCPTLCERLPLMSSGGETQRRPAVSHLSLSSSRLTEIEELYFLRLVRVHVLYLQEP